MPMSLDAMLCDCCNTMKGLILVPEHQSKINLLAPTSLRMLALQALIYLYYTLSLDPEDSWLTYMESVKVCCAVTQPETPVE